MRWWVAVLLLQLLASSRCLAKKQNKLEVTTDYEPDECSELAAAGDSLTVHYTGALEDGTVFDSSLNAGREPFTVQLGRGQVIRGWDEGLVGMCPGERRTLRIPSHLGYGDAGVDGVIPGGATLIFSVELLNLVKQSSIPIPKIPTSTEFYAYAGLLVLLVLMGYELYRRANKQGEDLKLQKKAAREKDRKNSSQRTPSGRKKKH